MTRRTGARSTTLAGMVTLAALVLTPAASAQEVARAPSVDMNVVHLSASASEDVPHDHLTVVLAAQHEGDDAARVQAALKRDLEAALAITRAAVRQAADVRTLDVHTGAFALHTRHVGPQAASARWIGRAELVVQGKDQARVAALVGEIGTLSVQQVVHGLSREAREAAETRVSAEAVARFRAKAAEAARLFGFGGHLLREVRLGSSQADGPRPMAMLRTGRATSMASESLPVQAGQATVRVEVQGSVQLTR